MAWSADQGPRWALACCCRSSVVEHSLGKGEVVGSIPPGSTSLIRFAVVQSIHEQEYYFTLRD